MRKLLYALSVMILLTGLLLFFYGCNIGDTKESDKQDKKTETTDLQKAETTRVATNEEWQQFKTDAEQRLAANEQKIADLKKQLKKPSKLFDKMYEDRIAKLEEQNKELRLKISIYEKEQTDWEVFKKEFNHDMDELGKAINNVFTDNNK
jgi:hypothetical protein